MLRGNMLRGNMLRGNMLRGKYDPPHYHPDNNPKLGIIFWSTILIHYFSLLFHIRVRF